MTCQTAPRRPRLSTAAALLFAALALLALPAAARAQGPKYQASSGFSPTQGQARWYYQYWNGSSYADMTWNGSYWVGSEGGLMVGSNWFHPAANDAVRKWVAPRSGVVQVSGQVRKADPGGGDGVNAKIVFKGATVFDQNIAYNDTAGYAATATLTVAAGDAVYFRINRRGNWNYDTTEWDAVVEYTDSVGSQWISSGSDIYYDAGKVGVGTASPGYRLDVQGGQVNASGGLCIAGICKSSWAEVGGGVQWSAQGANIFYNSGNVGVGTASPLSTLHAFHNYGAAASPAAVQNAGTSSVLPGMLVLGMNYNGGHSGAAVALRPERTAGGNGYDGDAVFYNQYYNGASYVWKERMRVTSAGNVGIGTASPSRKLEVVGDVNGLSFEAGSGSPHSGVIRFGDNTGWKLHFGRSRDAVNGALNYGTSGVLMTIQDNGNIGVGTHAPASKLHVAGDVTVDGNISAKYQDVAEWVPSTQKLQAGTVVVLDAARTNHVLASGEAYDTKVAGVVSAQPGIMLGEGGEGKLLIATTGRVRVRVDATKSPVRIGDLLVTGHTAGVAIRSEPVSVGGRKMHAPGTIIGKALEPLAGGVGEILVLLSLQ